MKPKVQARCLGKCIERRKESGGQNAREPQWNIKVAQIEHRSATR